MDRANRPLAGLRVLDFGQVYQGPYAGYLLAKAGAEVIKVEPPGGESVRQREVISAGSGVPFAMFNGHKKCMTLDLKTAAGKDILKRLVAEADVLLENFAPGVMDKLGVGWDTLSAINPRLVYASGSGYGLSGPDRNKLAMDITVQAASGMMSVTGFADGPPVKAGPAVADFLSGVHLYAGIVTALVERHATGKGRLVEVAMIEAVYPTLASNLTFYYDGAGVPPRTGNLHGGLSAAPYNVYAVSDGHVAIIGIQDAHWRSVLEAIGRLDLKDDPRFATKVNRVRHIAEVDEVISAGLATMTRQQACDLLERHKVPHAPVRDVVEVTNDPHLHQRKFLEWVDHPTVGRVALPDSPIHIHGADRLPAAIPARLGQHNEEVVTNLLGAGPDEFRAWQAAGAFGPVAGA